MDNSPLKIRAIAENIDCLFVDFGQLKDESQKELANNLDSIKVNID